MGKLTQDQSIMLIKLFEKYEIDQEQHLAYVFRDLALALGEKYEKDIASKKRRVGRPLSVSMHVKACLWLWICSEISNGTARGVGTACQNLIANGKYSEATDSDSLKATAYQYRTEILKESGLKSHLDTGFREACMEYYLRGGTFGPDGKEHMPWREG